VLDLRGDMQHGHGGGERQIVGAARIDPAQHRIHEHIDDLVAVPPPHQLADGDVLAGGEERAAPVVVQVRFRLDEILQLSEIGGYAHQSPGRNRTQRAAHGECRADGRRMPERLAQPHSPREPRGRALARRAEHQERLGPGLHRAAGDASGAQLATDAVRLIHDHDLDRAVARQFPQSQRGRETGYPPADDDDPDHATTFAQPPHRTRSPVPCRA
jgi:hypothetical protein